VPTGDSLLREEAEDSQGKTLRRPWKKGGLRVVVSLFPARSGEGKTRWIRELAGGVEGGKQAMRGEMKLLRVVLLLVAMGRLLWETDGMLACRREVMQLLRMVAGRCWPAVLQLSLLVQTALDWRRSHGAGVKMMVLEQDVQSPAALAHA
jgi:hypothetical protein